MRRILVISSLIVGLTSLLFVISCKKNGTADGTAKLQVYLVDDPGDYEAVYIDVKDIQINMTDDTSSGWQSLQGVNAGMYDLLKLVNDDDTILADTDIPTGRLHMIRLVLGTENYVKIQGTPDLIKLETPSGQQSGLKLKIQDYITANRLYKITLDFEVSKSIVKTGSKKYILKPVIRTILNVVGGTVKGVVQPGTFQTAVYAINGPDTVASTYTGADGGYVIKGLPAGAYDLYYNPSDILYHDSLRTSVNVQFNTVTIVDTTFLRMQ